MIYVGVDPGKKGGLVALDGPGRITEWCSMPVLGKSYDTDSVRRFFENLEISDAVVATVEESGPMPAIIRRAGKPDQTSGNKAQYFRGVSFGLWEGFFAGFGTVSHELAPTRAWQKTMLAGVDGSDTKQRALIAAQRLWPGQDWRATERCRKPHDGIVDAALIAEYGRRRRIGRAA